MLVQPLFSALPSGVLDLTADFTPLLVGLVVMLGLSVLGIVAANGVHDTRRAARTTTPLSASVPQFPKAARLFRRHWTKISSTFPS